MFIKYIVNVFQIDTINLKNANIVDPWVSF